MASSTYKQTSTTSQIKLWLFILLPNQIFPSKLLHCFPCRCATLSAFKMHGIHSDPKDLSSPVANQQKIWNFGVVVTIITIALSGATYGLENAIMSPLAAMPEFVKRYQGLNPQTGDYTFTASHQSMLFSIPLTGTIVSVP